MRNIVIPDPDRPWSSPLWDDPNGKHDPTDTLAPGTYTGHALNGLGKQVEVVLTIHDDGRPADLVDARVASL